MFPSNRTYDGLNTFKKVAMEPFSVSLNQINFERQTLGEKYENLNSFSNLVSYDEEFTGDIKSSISPTPFSCKFFSKL